MIPTLFILLVFGQAVVLSSCSGKERKVKKTSSTEINEFVILDVNKIIGKSLKTVNSILGEPESVEEFYAPIGKKLIEKEAIYHGKKIEIIFKNDIASLMFIYDTPDLTNDDNALQKLGLKNREPTSIITDNYTSWENVEGIALINCFENYIFVKLNNSKRSE